MIQRTRNPSTTEKILFTGKAIPSSHDSLSTTNVTNEINKATTSKQQENKYHQLFNEKETEDLNQVTNILLVHKSYNATNIISSPVKFIKLKLIIKSAMTTDVNSLETKNQRAKNVVLGKYHG